MAKAKPHQTYQQMSDELSRLINWFEGDSVNIDEAIIKYQEAIDLLAAMEDYLKNAQNKIQKIALKFE